MKKTTHTSIAQRILITPLACASLFLLLFSQAGEARALYCEDLSQLFEIYVRAHYAKKEITPELRNRTVEQYIKRLDPSKNYLLESDVTRITAELQAAFEPSGEIKCDRLIEAYQLKIKRNEEGVEFLDGFLGKDYKFDENTELVLNPDLRGFAKTIEERNAYLSKVAHFQISNYLLTDVKLEEAKRLLKKRNALALKRAKESQKKDALDQFAEAFAHALDPHSSYMPKDELDDFNILMQLSLEGIGASLTSDDGYTVIEELIPGGAADKMKQLKSKDKIIAVAQDDGKPAVNVIDMDLRDVVKLIRGKKGTKVHLTILRQSGNSSESLKISVVRDKVDLKESAAKLTYEIRKIEGREYKIGWIDLPSFYGGGKGEGRSCYSDLRALIGQAKDARVDGIVLDLSGNGGGLLDQAVLIGGLFIGKGGVVATQNTDRKVDILADRDPEVFYSGPLTVISSRMSASASEILAGALKDYKRALIVGGDHSFGKGTVQILAPLPDDLGAMKVTTGMFFLPGGLSTQHLGVASDLVLPSLLHTDEFGEKALDYSLPQQKVSPFISPDAQGKTAAEFWKPVKKEWVDELAKKSAERVAKNPAFAEMIKELEDSKKNAGLVKLADLRKKASEEKKDGKKPEKKRPKRFDEEKEESAPILVESLNVAFDYLQLAAPEKFSQAK